MSHISILKRIVASSAHNDNSNRQFMILVDFDFVKWQKQTYNIILQFKISLNEEV